MKLKQRVEDFRVREILGEGVLLERGRWRVYRVIKRKLTSLQAAEVLAYEAGVAAGEVSMCGLKDRQGVTVQHMALERGTDVSVAGDDVKIDVVGYADAPLDSKASEGNAFEIVVRGLVAEDQRTLRRNLAQVREQGLLNYFDDQRFGNLRHGQGWIALDLMRGETEKALKTLIAAPSFHDDARHKTLKRALDASWGDWAACRDIAGKFGAHHSVFEHLKRHPDDFAGAFFHVSSRLRLIHLYAYQSHLWNRAVVALVREKTTLEQRLVVESEEGPLVYPSDLALLGVAQGAAFPLPGPELEGIADELQRELLADALAADRLVPAQFKIEGVSGFQLKAEPRALVIVPEHLRVRPARPDPLNRGLSLVEVRFQLPRGAYATLVIRRLLATPGEAGAVERAGREAAGDDLEGFDELEGSGERRERSDERERPARPHSDRARPPREAPGSRGPRRDDRDAGPRRSFARDDRDRGDRPGRSGPSDRGRGPSRYGRDDRVAPRGEDHPQRAPARGDRDKGERPRRFPARDDRDRGPRRTDRGEGPKRFDRGGPRSPARDDRPQRFARDEGERPKRFARDDREQPRRFTRDDRAGPKRFPREGGERPQRFARDDERPGRFARDDRERPKRFTRDDRDRGKPERFVRDDRDRGKPERFVRDDRGSPRGPGRGPDRRDRREGPPSAQRGPPRPWERDPPRGRGGPPRETGKPRRDDDGRGGGPPRRRDDGPRGRFGGPKRFKRRDGGKGHG